MRTRMRGSGKWPGGVTLAGSKEWNGRSRHVGGVGAGRAGWPGMTGGRRQAGLWSSCNRLIWGRGGGGGG